jgi:hypothetical protein
MPIGLYADMELDRIVFEGLPNETEEKTDDQQTVRSPGQEVPGIVRASGPRANRTSGKQVPQ